MSCTFFQEVIITSKNIHFSNITGNVQNLYQRNDSYVYGLSSNPNNLKETITISGLIKPCDAIFIDRHTLGNMIINNTNVVFDKQTKLITSDFIKTTNFTITFGDLKTDHSLKRLGTIILLRKIGQLESLPTNFSFKLKTIGNFFNKSKGGATKIIYGIKANYKLEFIGINYNDINLLKKLYFFKHHFYMSLFPDNQDIQEQGLRIQDFLPLIMTGNFSPKLRTNVLGIGQDINITLEET